jgi:hypothetical protein
LPARRPISPHPPAQPPGASEPAVGMSSAAGRDEPRGQWSFGVGSRATIEHWPWWRTSRPGDASRASYCPHVEQLQPQAVDGHRMARSRHLCCTPESCRITWTPDRLSVRSRGRRSSWPATNGNGGRLRRRASSEASEIGPNEEVRDEKRNCRGTRRLAVQQGRSAMGSRAGEKHRRSVASRACAR